MVQYSFRRLLPEPRELTDEEYEHLEDFVDSLGFRLEGSPDGFEVKADASYGESEITYSMDEGNRGGTYMAFSWDMRATLTCSEDMLNETICHLQAMQKVIAEIKRIVGAKPSTED